MLTYGQGSVLNIVVDLGELEDAVLLLSNPGSPFNPEVGRWELFASAVVRAMDPPGLIHIVIPRDQFPEARKPDWRPRLPDAPDHLRTKIESLLTFFVERYGVVCDGHRVELV